MKNRLFRLNLPKRSTRRTSRKQNNTAPLPAGLFYAMYKVGITGGIGSGKTTVCRLFAQLGIPVYPADERAKALMTEDPQLTEAIRQLLGEETYSEQGELNRTYIASRVFNNAGLLEKLNSLVHPAVFRDFDHWATRQSGPYVIKEAALMFESGSYLDLDAVINVCAPEEIRLQRAIQRDNASEEQIRGRMSRQLSEEERVQRADYLIQNSGNELLIPQVMELHQIFLAKAAEKGL